MELVDEVESRMTDEESDDWKMCHDQLVKAEAQFTAKDIELRELREYRNSERRAWRRYEYSAWEVAQEVRNAIRKNRVDKHTVDQQTVLKAFVSDSNLRDGRIARLSCAQHEGVGDMYPFRATSRYLPCGVCVKSRNIVE